MLSFENTEHTAQTKTISGKTDRWLPVQGYDTYTIGYVFGGFLKPRKDLGYNEITDSCQVLARLVDCGEDKFSYSAGTPVVGSWYSQPGTEHGGLSYLYSELFSIPVYRPSGGFFQFSIYEFGSCDDKRNLLVAA